MRSASGRRYSGINERKFSFRETLFQIFLYHIPPTTHFGNGTTQKSDTTFFLFCKLQIRVSKATTLMDHLFLLIIRLVTDYKINNRFSIIQTMGMMIATGFQYDFDITSQSTITFSSNLHVLFIRHNLVTITTNAHHWNTGSR